MQISDRALGYARGIGQMLQIETVRRPGSEVEFLRLQALIAALFPQVEARCEKHCFAGSLLYRWPGSGGGDALLLMSHQDVVETTGNWRYPPFGGTIADGCLWGRGALDVKGNLFCILQAMEELINAGVTPPCDVYVASSHEEETGGNTLIADHLRRQGVSVGLLVDEGFCVEGAPVSDVPGEYALVGVAEKGYLDVKCIARGAGGHAAFPGKGTPLPRLGAFLCQIERDGLLPVQLNPACTELFRRLVPHAGAERGAALTHLADGAPGWEALLSERELAWLSTTVAFTMAAGSGAPNVLPSEAYVVCNLRLAPSDSGADCLRALERVAQAHRIELEVLRLNEPSPITDYTSPAFRRVERALEQVYPRVEALPFLLSGGTDTKHFTTLCPNCLRFTPLRVTPAQRAAVHGVDEHITVRALPAAVDFFKALICDGKDE